MKSKIAPPTADINEPIPNNRLIEVNGNQPPFAFVGFFFGGGGIYSKFDSKFAIHLNGNLATVTILDPRC